MASTYFYPHSNVCQSLENRLRSGKFSSTYEQYINENIRHSWYSDGTFYTKELEQNGREAAEAALVEWDRSWRMSDFAAVIEPVAEGMLAMAKADPQSVMLTDADKRNPFAHYKMNESGFLFIMLNKSAPGCGCTQPKESELFGPGGEIGIKAITLACDYNNPRITKLGIVMSLRGRNHLDYELWRSGFTVLTIDRDGDTDGETFIPSAADPDFLMKMLGLAAGPIPGHSCSSGGGLSHAVGFPGASEYLSRTLPRLKEYYSSLAEKLSNSGHKH
jgi:hypothetical protein